MVTCDELGNECNNCREPCSVELRGGYTATSVTGTGPGKYCPKPVDPVPEPAPTPRKTCKISVVVGGKLSYSRGALKSLKTC